MVILLPVWAQILIALITLGVLACLFVFTYYAALSSRHVWTLVRNKKNLTITL